MTFFLSISVSILDILCLSGGLIGAAYASSIYGFAVGYCVAGGALQAQWSLQRAVATNLVQKDEVEMKTTGFPHIFALNFVLIAGWQALLLHVPLHHGRGNAHRLRLQTGKIIFYPY